MKRVYDTVFDGKSVSETKLTNLMAEQLKGIASASGEFIAIPERTGPRIDIAFGKEDTGKTKL